MKPLLYLHLLYTYTYPMVVIKLVVKDPSEKRKRRQLLPTPAKSGNQQKKLRIQFHKS